MVLWKISTFVTLVINSQVFQQANLRWDLDDQVTDAKSLQVLGKAFAATYSGCFFECSLLLFQILQVYVRSIENLSQFIKKRTLPCMFAEYSIFFKKKDSSMGSM